MAQREQLDAAYRLTANAQMQALLVNVLQSRMPCTVALYYPIRGEPDLLSLMQHTALTSAVWALPVCCNTATGPLLRFARASAGSKLIVGQYGISIPAEQVWVDPDVVVLPCVGFYRSGHRLGYGAGWYDRTLSSLPPQTLSIGVAFASSESPESFAEPHDRPLDLIVTEHEVIPVRAHNGF